MYKFVAKVCSEYGTFSDGKVYSLHKVPKKVVDDWLKQGTIEKSDIKPMSDDEEVDTGK